MFSVRRGNPYRLEGQELDYLRQWQATQRDENELTAAEAASAVIFLIAVVGAIYLAIRFGWIIPTVLFILQALGWIIHAIGWIFGHWYIPLGLTISFVLLTVLLPKAEVGETQSDTHAALPLHEDQTRFLDSLPPDCPPAVREAIVTKFHAGNAAARAPFTWPPATKIVASSRWRSGASRWIVTLDETNVRLKTDSLKWSIGAEATFMPDTALVWQIVERAMARLIYVRLADGVDNDEERYTTLHLWTNTAEHVAWADETSGYPGTRLGVSVLRAGEALLWYGDEWIENERVMSTDTRFVDGKYKTTTSVRDVDTGYRERRIALANTKGQLVLYVAGIRGRRHKNGVPVYIPGERYYETMIIVYWPAYRTLPRQDALATTILACYIASRESTTDIKARRSPAPGSTQHPATVSEKSARVEAVET